MLSDGGAGGEDAGAGELTAVEDDGLAVAFELEAQPARPMIVAEANATVLMKRRVFVMIPESFR